VGVTQTQSVEFRQALEVQQVAQTRDLVLGKVELDGERMEGRRRRKKKKLMKIMKRGC
jgi:hypothetical protein